MLPSKTTKQINESTELDRTSTDILATGANPIHFPYADFERTLLPFAQNKSSIAKLFAVALLTDTHILIEDLPGIGKTTLAKAFARVCGLGFSRIQGTSDTIPQDIIGGEIFDFQTKQVEIRTGPIFQEIVLVDEINRMHPKAQSAFLQCMEEREVTLAGKTHVLPKVHSIIATQNPIEHEGTYPLPDAQKDRFGAVFHIGYPSASEQKNILILGGKTYLTQLFEEIKPIMNAEQIIAWRQQIERVQISERIIDRLLQFTEWTRIDPIFSHGISPRGIDIFVRAMKSVAYLEGREYVIPEDGKTILLPFIAHRLAIKKGLGQQNGISALIEEKFAAIVG